MNRKRIISVQSMQDAEPCEITYVTSKQEAREILAERERHMRIIADQGVWVTALLMRFAELNQIPAFLEFSPEEMQAAAERIGESPIHVARSREGGLRLALEPFDVAVAGSGNGVDIAVGDPDEDDAEPDLGDPGEAPATDDAHVVPRGAGDVPGAVDIAAGSSGAGDEQT